MTTTTNKDNVIVQVPQPLIHFPPFFPAQVATEGFSRTEITEYGDIISIASPRTPRVREMLIFLACLTFIEDGKVENDGAERLKITVSGKEWRRRAGLGRTKKERERWEESIKTLAAIQYDVEIEGAVGKDGRIYKKRSNPAPFNRVILSGILNGIKFRRKEDIVTFTIPKEFLKGIDITGLRISLTHLLALSGNISRLLAYTFYGRQSWLGTWNQLACLAGISDWEESWKKKQALKKALDELEKNGFRIEVGQEKIKITRKKGLLSGILEM